MRVLLRVVCWVLSLCDKYVVCEVLFFAGRCMLHVVRCVVVSCAVLRLMLPCCVFVCQFLLMCYLIQSYSAWLYVVCCAVYCIVLFFVMCLCRIVSHVGT